MRPTTRWCTRATAGVCVCVCVLSVLAAGCAGRIDGRYAPPTIEVPAAWPSQQRAAGRPDAAAASATVSTDVQDCTGRWWHDFGDPALDRLVAQAFAANNDLAAAAILVRRAQLQAGLAASNLWPSTSGSLSTSMSKPLKSGPADAAVQSSTITIGPSFEVDLWGRLASLRDVAGWEAEATEQDRASSAQSLAATTATLYWELAYLGQRIDVGADSVAYAERTLQLVQVQYHAGAASSLEVADAEQTLATQRAAQTTLEQQRVEAGNALALLFDGRTPGVADTVPRRLPDAAIPEVRPGLPAALLGRRPDLRAAELRLRGSFASIDATRASYYPAFTLNASVGGSSTMLGDVLRNPVGTLGAGLSLPFLNPNERRLNIGISEASYEEAVVTFRQTLYQALVDVDNALSARQFDALQAVELDRAVDAARRAERLYERRYRVGSATLRTWLDAQDRRRTAENAALENRYNRLVNHATLLRVLGGSVE